MEILLFLVILFSFIIKLKVIELLIYQIIHQSY